MGLIALGTIFEGFETSSTSMTMALFELAYRHEIQEKLRTEVEEVSARHGGKITYDAIAEMPYLDQVVNGNGHYLLNLMMACINVSYQIRNTSFVLAHRSAVQNRTS
jgi:hypothetical protein